MFTVAITDQRYVDACNHPDNKCLNGGVCRVVDYGKELVTYCNCTGNIGGSRCQIGESQLCIGNASDSRTCNPAAQAQYRGAHWLSKPAISVGSID